MCGIAGIFHLNGKAVDPACLRKMCDIMAHRGPDAQGQFVNGPLGLGHRRLSIIDLSDAGKQPMCNEDGSVWIVYNGEIYNFIELRAELVRKGHEFKSGTDTEVIIHLYEEYGEEFVKHLRGMFSFTIWDQRVQKLLLCRDRLGIKPLFYYADPGKFVFASELKAILCCDNLNKEINYGSIRDYFTYAYIPEPNTIFAHVKKLPPAHMLVLDADGMKLKKYWQLTYQWDDSLPEDFYLERLAEIIEESVKMHLISDVPLGAFLSGGVDSSTVVAMMKRANQHVRAFTIGYTEDDYDELKYAKEVAQHLNIDHNGIVIKPSDLLDVISKVTAQFDEPYADSSAIPTYYVCKYARQNIKVCLSGDGGDEAFGGYDRHVWASLYGSRADSLSRRGRKNLFSLVSHILPGGKLKDYLKVLALKPIELYGNRLSIFTQTASGTSVDDLLSDNFNETLKKHDSYSLIKHYYKETGTSSFLTNVRHIDTMTYLPGDNLTKVDRMSMLHSLEVRVPLLDHKVMEFAATIPPKFIVRNGQGKYILKKAMEKYLPHDILYRKKMGFMVPIKHWLNNELKDYFYDMISELKTKRKDIFDIEFIEYMIQRHKSGGEDLSYQLWTLMVFEEWARHYLD
jgi:asparagine synthase (glutamine-hydrolysing)